MNTFEEDFNAAYAEVYGPSRMADLQPHKQTRSRRKQSKKPRLTKMDHGQHTNKLQKHHGPSKKILSEAAKMQPRQDGKFASKNKSTFWTRLGEVVTGKAQRKIRASRRRARQLDEQMGRAAIPQAERRRRTRRRRRSSPVEQSYRRSVFGQVLKSLGLSGR